MSAQTPPWSQYEKNEAIRILENGIIELKKIPVKTPCMDCKFFRDRFCTKWQDNIPAETLPAGCDAWLFNPDSPPF